ncbi:MAG: undecaprenyl-diphosphate phosphatase [Lachnospiraceae bacterium]|jgi:undecaprenyl-diphosphatase|nr:undecaprenyl-diphosphate phosphatase [Lachnospiraceae bacterium]MCI9134086.1 undecaprenyl-diphosphate phosphatase [Lachnospiraceae bacterium]
MNLIEWLKVILLGVVEGITEWLPISSTGHMILIDELVKLNVSEEFMEMFLVVIQLGAILAVVTLYFSKLWPFTTPEKGWIKKKTWALWFKVLVAILPAAIIGIPFDDKIDALFYNYQTVAVTLIVYGVLFIVLENRNKGKKPVVRSLNQLTYPMAFFIGAFQVLALIPGTSRSGATILGAMLLGVSRHVAAEFSFFLAIPVMFGASLLKIVKFGIAFTPVELAVLLVGMAVAYVVSVFAIKFLMNYIKRRDFKAFGWYRIALGIVVLAYFLLQ